MGTTGQEIDHIHFEVLRQSALSNQWQEHLHSSNIIISNHCFAFLFYSILSHVFGRSPGHHRWINHNPFPPCPVFSYPCWAGKSTYENPQILPKLNLRSHPRHLVGKWLKNTKRHHHRHHQWQPAEPGRVAQSVGHLTRKSGVLGSIPGLATYFRFSFRFFKKGSCQLLAKVCAQSTG